VENQDPGISAAEQAVGKSSNLHPDIRMAIAQVVADTKGRAAEQPAADCPPDCKADVSDVALAVAYTSLMLEDPEHVTTRHLKMLRSRFSVEQIKELNELIRQLNA
jgi:hypothetical protein